MHTVLVEEAQELGLFCFLKKEKEQVFPEYHNF